VILDIITGKLKRPKGRPEDKKKPGWYLRIAYAAEYLEKVEKWKNTAAVTQIAKEFDVHERTVKRAIAFAKAREQQEARWEGRAATMINIASETLRSNPGSTVEQVAKDLEVSVYLVRYAAGMSANDAARWRAVEAAFQKALASGN